MDTVIGRFDLVTPTEHTQLQKEWAAVPDQYPHWTTIAERFEVQAAAHANSIALQCGDDRITYGKLNVQANRLARRLIAGV